MLTTKYVVVRKIEEAVVVSGSRGLQKTELQDLQLGVVVQSLRGSPCAKNVREVSLHFHELDHVA